MADNHFVALKEKISDCKKIEENLWNLLKEDKLGHLKDEHAQLKLIVSEITREISSVDAEQKYFSGVNTDIAKDFHKKLLLLEQLLLTQHTQLVDIDKLDHAQIINVLNGDKKGQDISQTSQQIQDIERGIDELASKRILPKLLDSIKEYEPFKIESAFSFDQSLKRIRDKWSDGRHLTALEFSQIISDKKNPACAELRKDILNTNIGEWISLALKFNNDTISYVTDLSLSDFKIIDGGTVNEHCGADYSSLNSKAVTIDAHGLNPDDLINSVPKEFKKIFGSATSVTLGKYGEWWPVSMRVGDDGIVWLHCDLYAASRGVR